MFNEISAKYLQKLLSMLLWLIFFLESIVGENTATTNSTTSSNETAQTTDAAPEGSWTVHTFVSLAVGGFVVVGGMCLVSYVVVVYMKRDKQRVPDHESGRRDHKTSNDYATHVPKSEERTRHDQAETADNEEPEDEIEGTIEVDGHYTTVEFTSGGSKSAARNTSDGKSKEATKESSDDEKPKKMKKKVNSDNSSNPVDTQAKKKGQNGTDKKEKSVEDIYTKVIKKKKHRQDESTVDELYTKSLKQQKKKKGASASNNGSLEELYTKSKKRQKGEATGASDELYTKPRKNRTQKRKDDADEMYSKPQKKMKKMPVYMNSADNPKEKNKSGQGKPKHKDEDENTPAMAAILQDNELYTDCPDLNDS